MSTVIYETDELTVNEFAGGVARGIMLQFTVSRYTGYAQLNVQDARRLTGVLLTWLAIRDGGDRGDSDVLVYDADGKRWYRDE